MRIFFFFFSKFQHIQMFLPETGLRFFWLSMRWLMAALRLIWILQKDGHVINQEWKDNYSIWFNESFWFYLLQVSKKIIKIKLLTIFWYFFSLLFMHVLTLLHGLSLVRRLWGCMMDLLGSEWMPNPEWHIHVALFFCPVC